MAIDYLGFVRLIEILTSETMRTRSITFRAVVPNRDAAGPEAVEYAPEAFLLRILVAFDSVMRSA